MKILSITAQKPNSTGSGTYLSELVNAWDRQGHEQAVVAGVYRDDDIVRFNADINFFPVSFTHKQYASVLGDISYPIVGMSDSMPYESTRYRDMTDDMIYEFESAFIQQIQAAVDALDPDLIVCHHLFLLTAIVRRSFPDRKIYGICHGTDLRQMLFCPRLAPIVAPEIAQLDKVFALHSEQATQISEIFDIAQDKIDVVGSGYNNRLFNSDERIERKTDEPVRICYAGKMSKTKGVPELLRALSRLSADAEAPAFHVNLVGGCQDEDVQRMLDSRPAYIDYLGQIPQTDLAKIYKSSDIFVLPSYFEGLNLAIIEAMATGLLPISTDLPGMQDWVNKNVSNPNIMYVPMPEMKTIDSPTEKGREDYVNNLATTLKQAILYIANNTVSVPDTYDITWDSVSNKITL